MSVRWDLGAFPDAPLSQRAGGCRRTSGPSRPRQRCASRPPQRDSLRSDPMDAGRPNRTVCHRDLVPLRAPVTPKPPIIDVLIARDGDAWRMYSAPFSWRVPFSGRTDTRGDVFPVARPDVADLDRFMWETDSPFERRVTADGGVEIVAKGRSAITLAVWLQDLVRRDT